MYFNKGNEEEIFISSSACLNFLLGQYPSGSQGHRSALGARLEMSFHSPHWHHTTQHLGHAETGVKASLSKLWAEFMEMKPILVGEEVPEEKITGDGERMC